MWRSCRIALAQDSCRKKQYELEPKEEAAAIGRIDVASSFSSPTGGSTRAEDDEKVKLFVSAIASGGGVCHGKSYGTSSPLCDLSSRAAVVSKAFLTLHFKKLPARMTFWSCCEAAKRKFTISFSKPTLCFIFRSQLEQSGEENTITEEVIVCLLNLGIHIYTPVLHSHRIFSLRQLRMATSDFAEKNILGKGSSGCVYRGKLASCGSSVAVKVLNVRLKDARFSFVTELEIMCHVQDRHIQPLLGYCAELGHLLLVYTYVPHGSLETWLHGNQMKAGAWGRSKLSWKDRCKVAFGITKALYYLHTECKPPIIHRDIKASNILLDKRNDPKLTDFGLAIKASLSNTICKDIMGTFGYLAPEYFQFGKVSTKIDIYSLGIVLLELITGRRPIDSNVPVREGNLANWARHLLCNTRSFTVRMVDPALGASYSSVGMERLLCIAALCIHPLDSQRPSIGKVLAFMEEEPAVRLHWLVMEAYRDDSFCLGYHLTFTSEQCNKDTRKNDEDLRKHYMEMATQDVEECSSLLCSPLIVL